MEPVDPAFQDLVRSVSPALNGYARARVPSADVDDVVSETWLVVWRRWAEGPTAEADRRRWAFGVARNALRNSRRSARRREQLHRALVISAMVEVSPDAMARILGTEAWSGLSTVDREVLAGALRVGPGRPLGCYLDLDPRLAAGRLARARGRLGPATDVTRP